MKLKPLHIVFIVLIIGTLLYLLFIKSNDKEYKWSKTFQNTTDEPYDFGVYNKLTEKYFDKNYKTIESDLIKDLKKSDSSKHNTYFFMGFYPFYTKDEVNSLLDFAAKGNSVFMVAEQFPDSFLQLANSFNGKEIFTNSFSEDSVSACLSYSDIYNDNTIFKVKKENNFWDIYEFWVYFNDNNDLYYYNETKFNRFKTLGYVNDKINFIKIKHHKGYIYLHTSPILFTNYFLIQNNGFNYVNEIIGREMCNTTFYRDYYSLLPKPEEKNSQKFSPNHQTPLSFILDNESFRWAWYIILLLIVLFFVFRAKRHQRLIPVMRRKDNSSIEYANTISNLYFNHSNHLEILKTKHQHWLFFIRTKLNILTNEINDKVIENISKKSGVDISRIKSIFHYSNKYYNSNFNINNETFIEINNEYEYFYKTYKLKNK